MSAGRGDSDSALARLAPPEHDHEPLPVQASALATVRESRVGIWDVR